jgi:hypothetical protein
MKTNILTVLCLFLILLGCKSQSKEFTLIGKWQLKETISGNGGGKKYHSNIFNGRTFEFKNNGEVINELGKKGKYQLEDENSEGTYLKLIFPNSEVEYFTLYSEENDTEKIILNPINSERQLICDCGCSEIYKKE